MNSKLLRNTGLSMAAALIAATSMAQGQVDIGLHRSGDMLEVHVRPQADFNGIFSAVVFTIRWDRTSGGTLGTITQELPAMQYIPIMRSGEARENGTNTYQVFAGFGTMPLATSSTAWVAGEEYVIAKFPVTGSGDFELVNDPWTHEPANNADYYVSLGGVNKTGDIYKSLANAEEIGGVTIVPNPNNGQFTFSFVNDTAMDVKVELLNALGQTVMNETIRGLDGPYRKEVDLTTMSNGVYYLKIKRNESLSVHKIVYR